MSYKKYIFISGVIACHLFTGCSNNIGEFLKLDNAPVVFPDYTSIVIPSNIAPLNFRINEKGTDYLVEIHSVIGDKIKIRQSSPKIKIPEKAWHKLLNSNKGNSLYINVYAKQDKWYKFATITDTIAPEKIDNHLVYRLIGIVYTFYGKLGIYQRNLENFDQSVIFENTSKEKKPCMNCHSFSGNNPNKMSLHIRRFEAGTVIFDNGELKKFNTKTKFTMSPGAYSAWHPNGEIIAFSVNRLLVNFTSDVEKIVEVWDKASDLILFDLKTNTITTSPKISTHSRENLPNWSPDGKWLYFTTAPPINKDSTNLIDAKYDLVRIPFNAKKFEWGEVDTLLTSRQTGKSITFPVASPDGRYILFCMIDRSYFSIFDRNSDLYILDLQTKQYKKSEILNSSATDSYHTWSKNGRWIAFSSKRLDGLTTRPFFSYFDTNGNFHKPFLLPQEDPDFYVDDTWNFNLPTLVDGKVQINANELRDFVAEDAQEVVFDKNVDTDALSGSTFIENSKKVATPKR